MKNIYKFGIALLLLMPGCKASFAPDNFVPKRSDFEMDSFGSFIKVVTVDGKEVSGELIGIRNDSVVVLWTKPVSVPRADVARAELITHNPNGYGWGFGTMLLTISNGGFLVFTAPLWIFSTAAAVSTENAKRFRYYPDQLTKGEQKRKLASTEEAWNEVFKFARFPMGIPGAVELGKLKKR